MSELELLLINHKIPRVNWGGLTADDLREFEFTSDRSSKSEERNFISSLKKYLGSKPVQFNWKDLYFLQNIPEIPTEVDVTMEPNETKTTNATEELFIESIYKIYDKNSVYFFTQDTLRPLISESKPVSGLLQIIKKYMQDDHDDNMKKTMVALFFIFFRSYVYNVVCALINKHNTELMIINSSLSNTSNYQFPQNEYEQYLIFLKKTLIDKTLPWYLETISDAFSGKFDYDLYIYTLCIEGLFQNYDKESPLPDGTTVTTFMSYLSLPDVPKLNRKLSIRQHFLRKKVQQKTFGEMHPLFDGFATENVTQENLTRLYDAVKGYFVFVKEIIDKALKLITNRGEKEKKMFGLHFWKIIRPAVFASVIKCHNKFTKLTTDDAKQKELSTNRNKYKSYVEQIAFLIITSSSVGKRRERRQTNEQASRKKSLLSRIQRAIGLSRRNRVNSVDYNYGSYYDTPSPTTEVSSKNV